MSFIKFIKQEIAVIKDRDPAIKSTIEALLQGEKNISESRKKDRYRDTSGSN